MSSKTYKRLNKKGVSPLIATVLLISFAVALGSVVLNWGRNLDISEPEDECSMVSIKLRNIENAQACYAGSGKNGYINFIIDNTGDTDIEGLGIWIVGEKGTKLLDFDEFSIKKGDLLSIKDDSVKYDFDTYGSIKHIQIIPNIEIEGAIEPCVKNSVKAENIRHC